MFNSVATKYALKKAGISSKTFDFSLPSSDPTPPPRQPNKLRKNPPPGWQPGQDDNDDAANGGWASWMSVKSLPLTAQAWLSPPPPPVAVGRVPGIGDKAPKDQQGKLRLGGGKRILVVFLRCVGCACESLYHFTLLHFHSWQNLFHFFYCTNKKIKVAQKTFVNLRTLANRYSGSLHCIAVSHASEQATKKWIDLLGGAWNVQIIVDEGRAIYAAWGLGLGGMWYLFNPTTQAQGWREKGWLGEKVAGAIQKKGVESSRTVVDGENDEEDEVSTVMGNKWQEAGAFAVDGTGTVIWGGKAERADDVMDLEFGARILTA